MRLSTPRSMASLTYVLGQDLYIPLTSHCNTRTLPETRGANFPLPPNVVSSLCTVRDLEQQAEQWKYWCVWLETQDDTTRHKLPVRDITITSSDIRQPKDGEPHRPTVDELLEEIREELEDSSYKSLVLAGEGEPTLRLDHLIELVTALRTEQETPSTTVPPIRLTTNGLIETSKPSIAAQRLSQAGVEQVSVALMTADAEQYHEFMEPINFGPDDAHLRVCNFIRCAVAEGLEVETTGVDRPEVDKAKAEELAKSLTVTKPFRWRSYFA